MCRGAPWLTVVDMETRRTRAISVVFIVLAALVAVLTAAVVYAFLEVYGPTTGSRLDGARAALGFGALGLVFLAGLAIAGLVIGRRWLPSRLAAGAVMVLGLFVVLASGSQATVTKYDSLPKVPKCTGDGAFGTTVQDAFAGMSHPQPFGAGWSSTSGCGADLLNSTRAEAAAYYRDKLPAAGWTISRDDATELRASRGDLVFTLTDRCGPPAVAIEHSSEAGARVC
jgi:hypothetical protein